jgi:hypothetical protein
LRRPERLDLALRLTLLGLLLRPIGDRPLRPPILLLGAAGLLLPPLLRRPGLWFALALLTGLRVALDWPLADNHAYLLVYWCLAIGLALGGAEAEKDLAASGRVLIGLVFALAVAWKGLLSPDYLDGRFFRLTLLLDPRFESFSRWIGGMSADQLDALRQFLRLHADLGPPATSVPLQPARFVLVAQAVTLWTLAIEAAIAVAFLWPRPAGPGRLRDALLLCFCATTYTVAGIESFGWLLLAMGAAQCDRQRPGWLVGYALVFALLLLSRETPWSALQPLAGSG